jgi:hypothetical protein
MYILIMVLNLCMFGSQSSSDPSFVVERVEAHAQFDSAYILALANTRLPPNKRVKQSEVECLLTELKDSGLFQKIKAKWDHVGDIRRLYLYTISRPDRERMPISKFSLVGLSDVNQNEFLKRMVEKGAFTGMPSLQFSYDHLNDIIDESIQQSVPADLRSKYVGSAWIEFKVDELGGVVVTIFHEQTDCKVRAS